MILDTDTYFRSLKLMLRPVLRFSLRNSIRLQQLIEVIKQAAVEVACEEIEKSGDSISISRLNVMTGIHRAEIARIYKRREVRTREEHIVYRVIYTWLQNPLYTTRDGKPRVLDVEGTESAFFKLVQSISTDLNPYTVLFEMERIGAVSRTQNGIRLVTRMYTPKDLGEGVRLLGDDVEDLFSAVQANVLDKQEMPNLHIKSQYDNVPERYHELIRKWFLKEGSAFHARACRFMSRFDRDHNRRIQQETGRVRVALCSFSLTENLNHKKDSSS